MSLTVKSQESLSSKVTASMDSISLLNRADSLGEKTALLSSKINFRTDSISGKIHAPADSLNAKLSLLKASLQQRLDSLKAKGQPSEKLQKNLDSLESLSQLPDEQYNKLFSLQQKVKDSINAKVPGLQKLNEVGGKTKDTMSEVNEVSTGLGIGPLGNDLKPDVNLQGDVNLPDLSGNGVMKTEMPNLGGSDNGLNTQLPDGPDINTPKKNIPAVNKNMSGLMPDEVTELKEKIGDVSGTLKEAGGIVKEGEEYTKEIKTIQEEGLGRSEKIPELAEKQLLNVDEVQALQQQQAASLGQMEEYKKMVEQYKDEKALKAEMEKKSKGLANDVFAKNHDKVDAAITKISKSKRRFSNVHDARYLPKRPPNAMKNSSWRERLVPGFSLHTFATDRTWIQFDPEVFYKFNENFSAGAGVMYRFSMNPAKITFDNFNNLNGIKVFAEYHAFKSFWLRAEAQQAYWKPWQLVSKDPFRVDKVYVAAAGICKNFNISKRVKGNAQTLYHFSWGESDPYKPKVILRVGFDLSLKKKEKKPWEDMLKALKKESR